MRVITVIQPWATLIALGEKRFETRSRKTNIRGNIAIHAGKRIDMTACEREPIKSTLAKHGYSIGNLPTGAVIAIAYLYDSYPITHVTDNAANSINSEGTILEMFDGNEFHFGWYEKGRHAWYFRHVSAIEPIKAKGQQGWWNFEYKLDHELLQEGDMVVMHTCMEANLPKYKDRVWTCRSKEFRQSSGAYSVMLEGFSGSFATEYLTKVGESEVVE